MRLLAVAAVLVVVVDALVGLALALGARCATAAVSAGSLTRVRGVRAIIVLLDRLMALLLLAPVVMVS
jgi:hypothetical protein